MSYCQPGDKPIVWYKFAQELKYQKVKLGFSPIDIQLVDIVPEKITTFIFTGVTYFTLPANPSRKRLRVRHAIQPNISITYSYPGRTWFLNSRSPELDLPGFTGKIDFYTTTYNASLPSYIYAVEEL